MTACACYNHAPRPARNRTFQRDPTRTLGIRLRFQRDLTHRFNRIKRLITQSLAVNDALGLIPRKPFVFMEAMPTGQFDFATDAKKQAAFMDWLHEQVDAGLLEIEPGEQLGTAIDSAWTNTYIKNSYQMGISRARAEAIKAGYPVPPIDAMPGGLAAAFATPGHADAVGAVYSRTFRGLVGITNQMVDRDISHALAQGMAEGKHPRRIAADINRRVEKYSGDAKRLARTETARAHHVATIQEYENAGVLGVSLLVEVSALGDACPQCQSVASGGPYSLKKAKGLLPVHPNCRCVALPEDVTDLSPAEIRALKG